MQRPPGARTLSGPNRQPGAMWPGRDLTPTIPLRQTRCNSGRIMTLATRTATETIRPFQELMAIHEATMTNLERKQAAMRARVARYADRSKRDRAVFWPPSGVAACNVLALKPDDGIERRSY